MLFCVCQRPLFCDIIIPGSIQRGNLPGQFINIDRKKYAVGLFWQPTGAGYVARTYARTLARSVDKKLNLYTEYRAMIGLGARKYGHASGMDSAAAAVAESLSGYTSFLAVFAVRGGFYLVAVRNGVILEDKLFNDEKDARAEYFKLSEIPDWGALFAPGAWGMPRATERNISDLINRVVRATLRPISRTRAIIISCLLILIFVGGVLWFFREPIIQMMTPQPELTQVSPEVAAEYERRLDEKNRELDEQFEIERAPEPEPIVLPYEYLPDVAQRAQVCYKAIAFLMQPITGWNQTTVECGQTHADAIFRRDYGTLDDFYTIATDLMPGSFVQQQSDDSLYVRATLPAVDIRASLDERDIETLARAVLTNFQNSNMMADVQMVTDTLTNGVDTVHLDILEVAAESKLNPMQFMDMFADFGGVYMTRCAWDAATRNWNYEVIIYAK